MPKTPKAPFSTIKRPTDSQVFAATKGHPFHKCKQCGLAIVASRVVCGECERLSEIGFGPVPRKCYPLPGQNTTPTQSYPSDNRSGYSDKISDSKFPPNRERN